MKIYSFDISYTTLRLITAAKAGFDGYRNNILSSIRPPTRSILSPHKSSHFATASHTLQITSDDNKIFEEYAKKILYLSPSDIAAIIKSVPCLETTKTLQCVEEAVNFVKLGGEEADISLMIRRCPFLLRPKPVKLFEEKVHILKDFGLEGENLLKLLKREPDILLDHHIPPALAFLQTGFQTKDLLVRAVVRVPYLIHSNLEKMAKPFVKTLEEFGIKGKDLNRPGLFTAFLSRNLTSSKLKAANLKQSHRRPSSAGPWSSASPTQKNRGFIRVSKLRFSR